jgi:3-oxoacyl-[acyl-carrier protein] reductase
MDLQLSDKVAIVTGASRGIGKAIAETLSAEGMKVVLVARSRDQLESTAGTLPNESLVQSIDLREPDSANRVIASSIERFGKLDVDGGATRAL